MITWFTVTCFYFSRSHVLIRNITMNNSFECSKRTDITEQPQSHDLLIANGNETANLLRHLANNEIDSDYFAVVSECESYGQETDAELSITAFALRAAGYVDALVESLEKALQRIAELDKDCRVYENNVKNLLERAGSAESSCAEAARILQSGERMALTRAITILLANGMKVEAEPVAVCTVKGGQMCPDGVHELFAAPQPTLVVPEEATPDSIEILASARRRDHAVFQWDEDQRNAAADSWNAFRAAMLQAVNSPVIGIDQATGADRTVEVRYVAPPGYVMLPKEPTKEMIDAGWLHYMATKNPSSKGTYKAMLAAAPQEVK
ncbi:Uncharacterised protein [Klebsiella pneumoniae]|nr:hypothetical protein HMPREF1308_05007 [Klebsiella pneumoniae subsp. pneumoniae WGLW5]EWE62362.1 hypothetical protein L443_05108 [Klebsiella pneumoniae BIDMC 14]KDH46194.1 hypothetical protein AE55_05532 [Klebsiella pneumoniae BWH 47]KMG40607.1 hypothetical protein SM52_04923 [Klebsiella pneumoniae]SCA23910.1 Uncharacterised protein [Klebsiella quasipneumoniae]